MAKAQVIEAQEFVLTDASGKKRAMLGTEAGMSFLALLDQNEEARMLFSLEGDGRAKITIHHLETSNWITLGFTEDGSPFLTFGEGEDKTRILLGVGSDGTASVGLSDSDGEEARAILAVTPDGEPHLGLFASDGEPMWSAP